MAEFYNWKQGFYTANAWGGAGSSNVATQAEPTTATKADNSSPLGLAIPMFVGTVAVNGSIIVDIDLIGGIRLKDGGKVVANLVIQFADTSLGGACELVWLKANDEFIFRDQAPKRSLVGLTFYPGSQTTVDPIVASYITNPTCWPKMAYAVLEDFDLTPYGGQLPTFRACISSNATAAASSAATSTVTFGTATGYFNVAMAYDATLGLAYQSCYSDNSHVYISTIDVASNTEIRRVQLPTTGTYGGLNDLVALNGSRYVVAQCYTQYDAGNIAGLRMIDTHTGEIVATLNAIKNTDGSNNGYWEPGIHSAHLLKSDAATKYVVLCFNENSLGISPASIPANDGSVVIADVTNGTLAYVAHPDQTPVRGASIQAILNAWAVKTISNGVLTAYFTEDNGQTVYSIDIGENGVSNLQSVYTTPTSFLSGVDYDTVDKAVVIALENQTLVKILLSDLSTDWTADVSATGAPYANSIYYSATNYTRDGYGVVTFGTDAAYLCDFSDGSITSLATDYAGYLVYDQYNGVAVEADHSGAFGVATAIYKYTFGDLTPNAVDAQDILTALETYTGEYVSADLTFTNFAGGECKGLLIDVDGTVSSFVDSVTGTFGIRRTHDAGKIKFKYPARDGSYAVDRVLDNSDIVLRNGEAIVKTEMDEDGALESGTLDYIDADADFAQSSAEFSRPNGIYSVIGSNRQENFSTSIVMSATQAAKALQRLIYETDYERSSYSLSIRPQNVDMEPGDIIQFPYGPADEITVVGEIRLGDILENFSQDIEVTEYLQAIETALVGTGLTTPTVTNVSTVSDMVILDTALLRYSDDLGGTGLRSYAVFLGAGTSNIPASSFYQSTDGYDYTQTGYASGVAPIAGTITGSITRNYSDAYQTDFAGTFSVQITAGDIANLATVSDTGFYALTNYAAIGQEGRWVLIAYKTVSTSGQTATLSEIIWGLHGTEVYLSSLVAGDQFINLEYDEVLAFANAASLIDTSVYYKGGYAGWLVGSLPTRKVTADGEAEKPFASIDGTATVTASGIQFTCEVRERLGNEPVMLGVESVGYSEGGVSIEWDIYDNSSPQTLLRTLTSTAENVTYTNAQIATDFGAMPATVTVKRYQISKLGKRGHVSTQVYTISNPATFDTNVLTFDTNLTTFDAAA